MRTDEFDALRALRAEVPEPDRAALRRSEARLIQALRTAPPPGARPARSRPAGWRSLGWRSGLAAGLAALTAAAVASALTVAGGPTAGPRPGDGTGSSGTGIGSSGTGAGPGTAVTAPALRPVSVAQVLDLAAQAAETGGELAPRADQFLVYESSTMYLSEQGGDGAESRYLYRTKRTVWRSVDGTRPGVVRIEQREPLPYPGRPLPSNVDFRVGQVEVRALPACPPAAEALRTDYAYLSRLSTDPAQMLAFLRAARRGGNGVDSRAFGAAGDLIRESYLPAAQRAALYRAIKAIPAVVLVDNAADASGRVGVAVARVEERTGIRHELIFDPVTFRYLGERAFVVDPAAAGAPAGSQVAGTAELSVAVADAVPEVPATPKGPKDAVAC